MGSFANSEDPDEMRISSGSVLFAKRKSIFRERNTIILEIITCDPSIYRMGHPDLNISSFMEKSIWSAAKVNFYEIFLDIGKHFLMLLVIFTIRHFV